MPDPIWLDNMIIDRAIKGDIPINKELAEYRKAGRQVLLVPAVYDEALRGHTADHKAVWQARMQKIGAIVDREGDRIPAAKRAEYLQIGKDNVSESDRKVLAQIKASAEARGVRNPQVLTAEEGNKAMRTQTFKWGVTSVNSASTAKSPRVDFKNYPDDRPAKDKGVSRFFKDRSFLKKLGVLGGSMLVSFFTGQIMKEIEAYYLGVCADALKDLDAAHPAISNAERAKIDAHKKAYEAALSKLKAPSNAKVAAGVIVALTKDKDRAAVYKELQKRLSKVKLADGTMGSYADAASAYLNAMADLHEKISNYLYDLPQAADDIQKRGALLTTIGDDLVQVYFERAHLMVIHVAYYMWMDVYNIGNTFKAVGSGVLGVAGAIRSRVSGYESLQQALDKELIRVSTELGKYSP